MLYNVAHKQHTIKSGKYNLRKLTKTQVRNEIKENHCFHGFICGNKVNPAHIADGWYIGVKVNYNDIKEFEKGIDDFETSLRVYTPELGRYTHYYQIINQ